MDNKVVEYVEGMNYGRGYNRLTGEALPSRAATGETARIKNAEGQPVDSSCRITTDVQTLHESLGISIKAGRQLHMGFSASAKVDYANKCDFSSLSSYIVVHIRGANAFEDITDPVFHADAEELLRTNNTIRFRDRFSDCFISGLRTGGEYFAIYQPTSTSETKKESLASDVRSPNDAFDYYQIRHSGRPSPSSRKKRFEFLELRDDIAFILEHSDDFMNPGRKRC